MSDDQGKDSFREEKSARIHRILTFLSVLLVLCAAALHFRAGRLQEDLMQTAISAQAQSMLTQRIALLISQYQAGSSEDLQENMRDTTSAALVNQETLESAFDSSLPPTLEDGSSTKDSVTAVGNFVRQSMAYAAGPQEKGAKEIAQSLIAQSRETGALWNNLTTEFIARAQSKIDSMERISEGLCLLIAALLIFQYLKLFGPAMACITEQRRQLSRLAAVDPLAGVYNRAMLFKVARMLIGTYKRQEEPLTALAIDIDKLGKVNATYGRAAGDALIKKVATVMSETLRDSDALGRLGGGEFGVFLPSLDEGRALLVAEKIRLAVEEMSFVVKTEALSISVSIGMAEMRAYHGSPDDMLLSAEAALRLAKERGNRIIAFNVIESGKA